MFFNESRVISLFYLNTTFVSIMSGTCYDKENITELHRYGGAGLFVLWGFFLD